MLKTYSAYLVTDNGRLKLLHTFGTTSARANLMFAQTIAKPYVDKGNHILILSGDEIVWNSRETIPVLCDEQMQELDQLAANNAAYKARYSVRITLDILE